MSDGYNGRDFYIEKGDERIAACTTKSVTRNKAEVDVTNDDSDGNRTLLAKAGTKSIDVSAEGVATSENYASLVEAWHNDQMVSVKAVGPDGSTEESGDAFFQNLEHSGDHDGFVEFTATFLMSGAITLTLS